MIVSGGFSGWFGPCGKPVEKRNTKNPRELDCFVSCQVSVDKPLESISECPLIWNATDTTVQRVAILLSLKLISIHSQDGKFCSGRGVVIFLFMPLNSSHVES
ncbi:hypothetical protein GOODEAATRI_012347 [Goodea atripinnis]|uniref:Uncharacterized protein n=1 Tax=Goodea atripinnis TaxID=208336 RepID=A0ABV0NU01_9TELE